MHKKNAAARDNGYGDSWDRSVRDQMGGSRAAQHVEQLSPEKAENQTYWKARRIYSKRWVVEYVFSAFKRMLGEHMSALK